MDPAFDASFLLQLFLCVIEAREAFFHPEPWEFPLDDVGKPDESPHIPEPDGAEGFLCLQDFQACLLQGSFPAGQVLPRERDGGKLRQKQLHQFPVVFRADLLGDKDAAGP